MRVVEERERYLNEYAFGLRMRERGEVISIGDGIAWIAGLPSAAIDQLLKFEDGSTAPSLLRHFRYLPRALEYGS